MFTYLRARLPQKLELINVASGTTIDFQAASSYSSGAPLQSVTSVKARHYNMLTVLAPIAVVLELNKFFSGIVYPKDHRKV